MRPEDSDLLLAAVTAPGREREVTRDDILRHFNTTDGRGLGLRLLREAALERDPVGLEAAVVVCNLFGFGAEHLELLIDLTSAGWHEQHENVVSMLSKLRDPGGVVALRCAATWVPSYLDWDENRALAVKAIWGLGGIAGAEAEQALLGLLEDEDEIVREEAEVQLRRRRA
ncbi:HEAT repeat domain-containing protein [Micromonospora harpali]|uniref:HEAT repeat-containing protein n=1 Tax=Micromonospora harpali TaxID=1490225 RepID=A0ABW1HEY8_9ACTN